MGSCVMLSVSFVFLYVAILSTGFLNIVFVTSRLLVAHNSTSESRLSLIPSRRLVSSPSLSCIVCVPIISCSCSVVGYLGLALKSPYIYDIYWSFTYLFVSNVLKVVI